MRGTARIGLTALGVAALSGGLSYAFDWPWSDQPATSRFMHVVIDGQGPRDPWGKSVGDINGDGHIDLIVGGHDSKELVWYRNPSWVKFTIAKGAAFSTDHEVADIDGDGRNDVLSLTQTHLLWYQNSNWTPTAIDAVGLHDIEVADFDGDGDFDVVGRNQSAFGSSGNTLYFYRQDAPDEWVRFTVAIPDGEGLKVFDIDGDGRPDVIVNEQWLSNPGGRLGERAWSAHSYTASWIWPHVYIDVGDINADGRADIVLAPAEPAGEHYHIAWFEAPKESKSLWKEHVIDPNVETVHHFIAIGDMDNDGTRDIVSAEMHQGADPDEINIYFNRDRRGSAWDKRVIATTGSHSMRSVDVDGDGDLDLFGANWSGDHQSVELWLNRACDSAWRRHVVDSGKPWRAIFVTAADIDGDGHKDIIAGGWWYRNPDKAAQRWERHTIGRTARNMAAVYDFDRDGDLDVLSTEGRDSEPNADFVWARNDGRGHFEIISVGRARGDFLQGVAIDKFAPGERTGVALSWHEKDHGVQMFTIPSDPTVNNWPWRLISASSQDEALSAGDIDRDGDSDLLLGTRWLRNDGDQWTAFPLFKTEANPDRNRLVDMNGDGRLDAVIGYEAISTTGVLAWYEQGRDSTGQWLEHVIAHVTGPMSLDVADMDRDRDLDVIVGEHNLDNPASARLLVFENLDDLARKWRQHIVHVGDEHHDGAQVVDIDDDGDMDIVSIGWGHRKVLLYENLAANCPTNMHVHAAGGLVQ